MIRPLLRLAHRAALRAYPRHFLDRFGADLERAFDARVLAPPMAAGRRAAVVLFHLADAIFSGHRLAREIDSENPAIPLPFKRERKVVERELAAL